MPGHRHWVMFLEDHDDSREAFATLVSTRGVDVAASANGADALAHLRQDPRRWCLVVFDWWLADMTGDEFLGAVRADPRLADITLAVVTGDARVRGAATALGVTNFFLKPVDLDELLHLVSHHCDMPKGTGGTGTGTTGTDDAAG